MLTIINPSEEMRIEIEGLNRQLRRRREAQGSLAVRRKRAAGIGDFRRLHSLQEGEIDAWFGGAPLVGIDGSVSSFGADYPYLIYLYRALARSSRPGAGEEKIWLNRIFSPLLPQGQAELERITGEGLSPEEGLARLRWRILARMEAEAGLKSLLQEKPRLLLWDGGFARLMQHAPEIWTELRERALATGTVMLGVTEEIATSVLAPLLNLPVGEYQPHADREILFGLLQPGESFRLRHSDQRRIYLRLASHPQVVAVDYLPEQESLLDTAINYLYTITPSRGRGFPLWLDLIDAEVRLTREEVELLLANCLDPELCEVFLRPLRSEREL